MSGNLNHRSAQTIKSCDGRIQQNTVVNTKTTISRDGRRQQNTVVNTKTVISCDERIQNTIILQHSNLINLCPKGAIGVRLKLPEHPQILSLSFIMPKLYRRKITLVKNPPIKPCHSDQQYVSLKLRAAYVFFKFRMDAIQGIF